MCLTLTIVVNNSDKSDEMTIMMVIARISKNKMDKDQKLLIIFFCERFFSIQVCLRVDYTRNNI